MDGLENVISVLDYVLDTKRKRHIMGGILLSVSFLFGGLAITVMTIRNEHSGDMSRVFKKDFDIFFRKKGNFNRPSAENPKANISSC